MNKGISIKEKKWTFLALLPLAPLASTELNNNSYQTQPISGNTVEVHYEATWTDAMPPPKTADIEILFRLLRNGNQISEIGWYEYDASPAYDFYLLTFKDRDGNPIELDDATDTLKVETRYWPQEDHSRGGPYLYDENALDLY